MPKFAHLDEHSNTARKVYMIKMKRIWNFGWRVKKNSGLNLFILYLLSLFLLIIEEGKLKLN